MLILRKEVKSYGAQRTLPRWRHAATGSFVEVESLP